MLLQSKSYSTALRWSLPLIRVRSNYAAQEVQNSLDFLPRLTLHLGRNNVRSRGHCAGCQVFSVTRAETETHRCSEAEVGQASDSSHQILPVSKSHMRERDLHWSFDAIRHEVVFKSSQHLVFAVVKADQELVLRVPKLASLNNVC